jgi:RND family efflux transporter MFP subunit
MFEDGELVNHGTPIATLADVSLLKVEINVPASLYIKINAITDVDCTQENIPGETFPLTLYANNIKANNNGLYKLYLYYKPNSDSKLAPGMNVSVNINYEAQKTTLLSIPVNAVFEKDGSCYVWVVENNVVKARNIETNNLISNGNIGVLEGLVAGEHVVTGGVNLLSDEETVRVVSPQSKTNIGNLL